MNSDVRFSLPARRRAILAGCLMALTLLAALPATGRAQNFGLKNLQGKVYDANNAPISGAIVYLKNSRNNDVKTFLSEKDGNYRFAGLSADTDYSVWAAYHAKKSDSKTVSSFDSRKQVYIDLKIKE
ncbi:MAG TPA: carboxypeptidase-like regulatory domain-containing protein [Acidobacteriaceae bacterium]|nr:carboxypeptidase-like regulatory domain-containing protein [Acidobacteriaceae bacterium]